MRGAAGAVVALTVLVGCAAGPGPAPNHADSRPTFGVLAGATGTDILPERFLLDLETLDGEFVAAAAGDSGLGRAFLAASDNMVCLFVAHVDDGPGFSGTSVCGPVADLAVRVVSVSDSEVTAVVVPDGCAVVADVEAVDLSNVVLFGEPAVAGSLDCGWGALRFGSGPVVD